MDLSKIDQDPLVYFLTPAPVRDEDEDEDEDDAPMDFDMDFDAGIEDANHPPTIVRSVSPSSLDGLALPPPRPPTPPRSPATPDLAHGMPSPPDDVESYIAFGGRARALSFGLPFLLKDLTAGKSSSAKARRTRTVRARTQPDDASLLSPGRGHPINPAGPRPVATAPGSSNQRGRSGTVSSSRRSSPRHSWREPSPDVFSIEEETEEEVNSEMGDSVVGEGETARMVRARAIQIPAAKPTKKVRFVLPSEQY